MDGFLPLPPGLMIAAPASGTGKTVVTAGLLRAFRRRGLAVQPFKCGPDYIDPAFHTAAAGRTCYNLDSWAMRQETAAAILDRACRTADLVIVEALMGLFDGAGSTGSWGSGASADTAAAAGWPVVLVLDISAQSQSAAAAASGFAKFRSDVAVAGVILNRAGGARHAAAVIRAMETAGIPVFGCLPYAPEMVLPERYLGLVQAGELPAIEDRMDNMARVLEANVNVADLVSAARPGRFPARPGRELPLPGFRIALAYDAAFSFIYPHLLDSWKAQGAAILPFSPLADEGPDPSADIAWLPGGYPELYGAELAAARGFKQSLRRFAANRPVHGECGGYMVLGQGITSADGARHEMTGLLSLESSLANRRLHLGYRRARLTAGCPLGAPGTVLLGHEFRFAAAEAGSDAPLAAISGADEGEAAAGGSRRGHVTGSFFHVIDHVIGGANGGAEQD